MQRADAERALRSLGHKGSHETLVALPNGQMKLLTLGVGQYATVFRHGTLFDLFVVGADAECPAATLRDFMDVSVVPASDDYAARIGVAQRERDFLRKRLKEASVSLDVVAKGLKVRVRPADIPIHPQIIAYLERAADRTAYQKHLPDVLMKDRGLINQLHSTALHWKSEIEKLVKMAHDGPGTVLSAEEETMFWSSLDTALTNARITLFSENVDLILRLLLSHKREVRFFGQATESLAQGRLKAVGVLNLVQGLPIVPLRSADSEDNLLGATAVFWKHMLDKLGISALPIERAMSLTDVLSVEVSVSLTAILKARGGLLNIPFHAFEKFVRQSRDVFECWEGNAEKFRRAARDVAIRRDEPLPSRVPPRFSALKTRIQEAMEIRSHHNALRTLLVKQLQSTTTAESSLRKLNDAFKTVVELTADGLEVKTSPEGVKQWATAQERYSTMTDEVEEAIAQQYQDAVSGLQNLAAMAKFGRDFKLLLDRPFMENATGVLLPKVLECAESSLLTLRKQWERYKEPKTAFPFRHLPDVCTRIFQARVLNRALTSIQEEITGVLGSVRVSSDPDIMEFVLKLTQFKEQANPKQMLKNWLYATSEVDLVPPNALVTVISTRGKLDLQVGIDSSTVDMLRAFFIFEHDPILSNALSSPDLRSKFRSGKHLLQIDSLLRSSCASYSDAYQLSQSLDSRDFALVTPLVSDLLMESRSSFFELSTLTMIDRPPTLMSAAQQCFAHCRSYADTFRALVDEHQFIVECMVVLSSFCFKLEDDADGARAKEVSEMLIRVNQTLRSMKRRVPQKFKQYLTVSIKNLFESVFDTVLVLSIRHWTSTLNNGGISVLKTKLRLSSVGDICLLDPDVNEVHVAALAQLRAVSAGAYNSLNGQEFVEEDDPMRFVQLPSLDACFKENSAATKEVSLAMKGLSTELKRLEEGARQWSKFTFVYSIDKATLVSSVSNNIENAHEMLSSLSSALEEIRGFEHGAQCSSYLEFSTVSKQLQSSLTSLIRDALEACSEHGAAQTHEAHSLLSKSKSDIKAAVDKDPLELLLSLKAVEETVLDATDSKITSLHYIETLISKTPEVSMPDNWISFDVLGAELGMLRNLYSERSSAAIGNNAELGEKYEKDKETFEASLAEFHERSGKVWELHGSVSSPADRKSVCLALPDFEESLSVLKDEGQELSRQCARLKSIERALGREQSDSNLLLEALTVEVDKVCKSLVSLRELADRLRELGSYSFEAFNGAAARKEVEAISTEITALESLHGPSAAVSNIRAVAQNHLKIHGLLSHLRTCDLSPLRERDVLKTVFGEVESVEPLLKKKLIEFWQADVQKHDAYLRGVFDLAAGESALAEFMAGVRRTWSARAPTFVQKDGIQLLDGIPSLVDELHDQVQALGTMKSSQFVALFEEERKSWEVRLSRCEEVLEQLTEVQMQWLHLHSLFEAGSSGSLRKKLQKEYIAFSNANSQIMSFFDALSQSPGLVEGLNAQSGLDRILNDLGDIVRSLSKFLESQRSAFPRFFFMSDADLLLVLSMSPKRIESLVPSLGKLFSGIGQLEFKLTDSDGAVAFAVISKEGERLELCRPVHFKDGSSITDFLSSLDETMKESLRLLLPQGLKIAEALLYASEKLSGDSLREMLDKIPSQTLLLAARILFTQKVDACFSKSPVCFDDLLRQKTETLDQLCSCMLASEGEQHTSNPVLTKREHIIKDLVYQRDTLQTLISNKVSNSSAQEWYHQLRMYVTSQTAIVKCAEAEFEYGWEYLGVGDTLVQTPLTSRCYLTLSQALHRGLGGSPFGPAGTGKTETVKSLGRILGRNVVVFNCDESFDAVSVGRILAGVSRVGFWVCFDEFNRLSASSLSATSQQLSVLQTAVKSGYKSVENFYGGEVPISIGEGLGIFITMNPTYSGRRELPSNLKSLFRPCAMPRPDYLIIAEVLLLSYSFRDARTLGAKLVHLFECLKRVVRSRPHYDFGLRSLKSAIVIAGSLQNLASAANMEEDRAVVLALHETMKPRLLPEDVHDYNAYIANLFPNVATSSLELPEKLRNAVQSACQEQNIQISPAFLERLGQLYNLLKHRPGVMLVGGTGCGKSVSWRILFESLRRLEDSQNEEGSTTDRNSSVTVLDPKLLTSAQLYGCLDATTREWTDGIFTKRLRECTLSSGGSEGGNGVHWIVFDGDIDPNWVENLNSVLDDTRLLTLPSGERIPLSSNIRVLFEVDSLKHANPSTVSRCGLVYFDDGEPLSSVLKSKFVSSLARAGILQTVSDEVLLMVDVFCGFSSSISKYGTGVLQQPQCALISGIITMFSSMLAQLLSRDGSKGQSDGANDAIGTPVGRTTSCPEVGASLSCSVVAHCFLFSVKTVIGSGFRQENAVELYSALLKHMTGCSHFLDKILCEFDGSSLLGGAFDCKTESLRNFRTMASEKMVLESLPDQIGSPDIVIPTASSIRLTHIVRDAIWNQGLLRQEQSMVVLCGPPGCGKSMVLTAALNELPGVELCTISMSSRTTVLDVISVLKAHMELSKNLNGDMVLSPKAPSKQTVLFCDEVNLGEPDEYGTQHVSSFLRCLVERNGFWNGSPLRWTNVVGLRIVAACNPAEDAGRHELPPRLMRHAILVRVEQPNHHDFLTIFKVHISGLLKYLDPRLENRSNSLTSAMVDFFLMNKKKFAPSLTGPIEPHYVYSARELIRWVRGMKHILTCNMGSSNILRSSGISSTRKVENVWNDVIQAFCHEARRLFMDRLVTKSDHRFGESSLLEVVKAHLSHGVTNLPDPIYTSWMKSDGDETAGYFFQAVTDMTGFQDMVYRKLRVFAEEEGLGGSWMSGNGSGPAEEQADQFVVTDDVLKHLTRIERVLSLPLGHAVLMGVPGTGKKTLARFAAWMMGATVFQVRSHEGYTAADFANDLRNVLRQAGVYHQKMVVIFDESNDLDSAFLEMMNSILACGDVPGLFEGEDKAALLREIQENRSRSSSSDLHSGGLYMQFLDGVRANLHVIFSIPIVHDPAKSSDGEKSKGGTSKDLTSRSPALYNRCIVDWYGDWDIVTLENIAVAKLNFREEDMFEHVALAAIRFHTTAARHFASISSQTISVTPRHFLEFIEQVNRIHTEKSDFLYGVVERLQEGLHKLREAGMAVDDLKEELSEKAIRLTEKEAEANETLRQMSEEQRLAEKSKIEAEKLAAAATEAAEVAQLQQEEVAGKLADVEPKVMAAREAVGSIRKKDLDLLRTLTHPPRGVKIAMEAVLILLDASAGSFGHAYTWNEVRGRVRDRGFIASIINFDTDMVPMDRRQEIDDRIFQNPHFDIGKINRASPSAGSLAIWVHAILDYCAVIESIEPLREEAEALQENVNILSQENIEAMESVTEMENRIEQCRSQYAILVADAERVRAEIKEAEENVKQTENMIDSLGGEWKRWIDELQAYLGDADKTWGNSILSAGFVAYSGPLDQQLRKTLRDEWCHILENEAIEFNRELNISTFLTSAEDRAFWTRQNIPTDATSLENYAILLRSARYPLIVDPSGKASELLQSILGCSSGRLTPASKRVSGKKSTSSSISVTSFAQMGKKSYMRAVESAVRFGTAVLIDNAERFDYTVLPLLGQESSFGSSGTLGKLGGEGQGTSGAQGGMNRSQQRLVRLGDKDVALSPGFRMFLASSSPKDVPASALSRASVVSFAMSTAALKSKCISCTLTVLQPAIEEQRTSYMISSMECAKRKKELEDSLLVEIRNTDDIGAELLNGSLIGTLSNLKEESNRVKEQEAANVAMVEEALQYEKKFQCLAKAALTIYNVLENLQQLSLLYRFSAVEFFHLFDAALSQATKTGSETTPSPFDIHRELVRAVFLHVVPSLFPEHKLPFASALVTGATLFEDDSSKGSLGPEHLSELHAVLAKVSSDGVGAGPVQVSDLKLGQQLSSLMKTVSDQSEHKSFAGNAAHPLSNILTIGNSDKGSLPQLFGQLGTILPGGRSTLNGPPTRADVVLSNVLESLAGRDSTESQNALYRPLLLCSKGANSDPCQLVNNVAVRLSLGVESIALSNEHTPEVLGEILGVAARRSTNEPFAILMKNMHLASRKCCERLTREIARFPEGMSYQLILAAEVTGGVPPYFADLATECRVLAFEVPSSLRTNLSRCHAVLNASLGDDWLRRTYIAITWLHGALLERRQYSPVGFSKPYGFSEGDLISAWSAVMNHHKSGTDLKSEHSVSALIHLLSTTVYGGRVECQADVQVLHEFISDLFYRVLLKEVNSASVAVVDPAHVQEKISVAVDDPLMQKISDELPELVPTDWFGMPPKTSEGYKVREGIHITNTFIGLLPCQSEETQSVPDSSNAADVKKRSLDMIQAVMDGLPDVQESAQREADYGSALKRYFQRELELCVECVSFIKEDLESLRDVINRSRRESPRSVSLKAAVASWNVHCTTKLPSEWQAYTKYAGAHGTIRGLTQKLRSGYDWLARMLGGGSVGEQAVNVALALRPSSLVSALGQFEADKAGVSENKLQLVLGTQRHVDDKDSWGMQGLQLEGGRWNGEKGVVEYADGNPGELKGCRMWWGDAEAREKCAAKNNLGYILLPMYGSATRDGLVCEVYVPVDRKIATGKWRLSATALVISSAT